MVKKKEREKCLTFLVIIFNLQRTHGRILLELSNHSQEDVASSTTVADDHQQELLGWGEEMCENMKPLQLSSSSCSVALGCMKLCEAA